MLHDPDSDHDVREALLEERTGLDAFSDTERAFHRKKLERIARRAASGFYYTPEAAARTAAILQEKFALSNPWGPQIQ